MSLTVSAPPLPTWTEYEGVPVEWVEIDTILNEFDSVDFDLDPYHDDRFLECWEQLLEGKRCDGHYEDVVNSIQTRGLLRPFQYWTVPVRRGETGKKFGDGHHRLAACIDLGWTRIPMIQTDGSWISGDSGSWREGRNIYVGIRENRLMTPGGEIIEAENEWGDDYEDCNCPSCRQDREGLE